MKIVSFSVANVRSIADRVTLRFEDGLNILIGANGGGKSNLIDALNMVLHEWFFWHFSERTELARTTYVREHLDNFFALDKHVDKIAEPQSVSIEMRLQPEDVVGLRIVRDRLEDLIRTERQIGNGVDSELHNALRPAFAAVDLGVLTGSEILQYDVTAPNLGVNTFGQNPGQLAPLGRLFLSYSNYFEKIGYLIERFNETQPDAAAIEPLPYPVKFYSAARFHQHETFVYQVPNTNLAQLRKETKSKTSRTVSSDIQLSTFIFAYEKQRLAFDNFDRHERGEALGGRFSDLPIMAETREHLARLGDYDFEVRTVHRKDARYEFVFRIGGRDVPFRLLSSGEREAMNLLLSIVALDLRNTLLVIDEPEIHLHPNWQRKMVRLLQSVAAARGLQFLLATHSPIFVEPSTIVNITRVHKVGRRTTLSPPQRNDSWRQKLGREQDLVETLTYSNNAKSFFADRVILVEGPGEEIIFSYLVEQLLPNLPEVQVIPVGGKDNFLKYVRLLSCFGIETVIFADLDNLWSGSLLASHDLVRNLRAAIQGRVDGQDLKSLAPYLDAADIKDGITKRAVGKRILDIVTRIRSGAIPSQADLDFLTHWQSKCLLKGKVLHGLDLGKVFNGAEPRVPNLAALLNRLRGGVAFDGVNIPVHLLRRGQLEDYFDGLDHDRSGALKALAELRAYVKGQATLAPVEELVGMVQSAGSARPRPTPSEVEPAPLLPLDWPA